MVPSLRLNEHYTSVQGEGPHTGELTQFVRFSGCNMRCPGWPCDTPHAIEPSLWRNDPQLHPTDIYAAILSKAAESGASRICLTGGEPMMQPNDAMRALIQQLSTTGFKIDMFSNGSFLYPEWLMSCPHLTIIMDWKLRGSGEAEKKVEEREQNVRKLRPHDCVKFVVTDRADLDEANNWTHYWTSHQMFRGIFYVGAAWGHIKDDELVEYIQEFRLPWRLNVQVHKHIWGELRGV